MAKRTATTAHFGRDPQDAVVAFLNTPGIVGDDVPRHIETHIAHVFVGRERALKIKRAVKLPYLDFSSLEQRRAACLREIEVNQPTAPDLYLGVGPITVREDGRLAVGGAGTAIEWAVEMLAFAAGNLLSERARDGRLTTEILLETADVVARMHACAAPQTPIDHPGEMLEIVDDVVRACETTSLGADPEQLTRFVMAARGAIDRHHELLLQRGAEGHVRRCHGDLHLANIVMWRGHPTPFDAIEFSEQIATVDTLYDLAFLLMDLEHAMNRAAANQLFNRYLWRVGEAESLRALALLPFYLSLRAAIRAMVAGERASLAEDAAAAEQDRRAAREYLAMACRYLAPHPPDLIAVGGLSGSGKSTLAAALAPEFGAAPGAVLLRSDLERKRMLGVASTDRLPAESYTPASAEAVYARILARAGEALTAGHSVIVDAVSAREEERSALCDLAQRLGVGFRALWLDASDETLKQRVAQRVGDASDATPDVVERQIARGTGRIGWQRIDASGGAAETLAQAQAALSRG